VKGHPRNNDQEPRISPVSRITPNKRYFPGKSSGKTIVITDEATEAVIKPIRSVV